METVMTLHFGCVHTRNSLAKGAATATGCRHSTVIAGTHTLWPFGGKGASSHGSPCDSAPKLEQLADADGMDLASKMYDTDTERSFTFSQYSFDQAYRACGRSALINLGISSGATNVLR